MRRFAHSALVLTAVILLGSCAPAPSAPPDPSVTNAELGISLAAVPEGFEVARNEGAVLELRPVGEIAGGSVLFTVGPEETGVNLVAAVKAHQAHIEGLPGGEYQGAQELQGPLGTAFYSRGRFEGGDGPEEETVTLTLHPSQSRLLEITYDYPVGNDSAARVKELIGVLAEVEGTQQEGS